MAQASRDVKKALTALQGKIREGTGTETPNAMTLNDRRPHPPVSIYLTHSQVAAMKKALAAIGADPHFEYLDPAEHEIHEFIADCAANKGTDHVRPFMDKYSKELQELTCYLGVESLGVPEQVEIAGIRVLPLTQAEIPPTLIDIDKAARSVAAVPVTGTGLMAMVARARGQAQHALSVLRMGLRQPPGVNPQQLRFRLGIGHAFSGSGNTAGWQAHSEMAYSIDLPADPDRYLVGPASTLPIKGSKGSIDEKALLAMEWLDRASFTADPLVATLFRFFALEALLGDKSEGLKSGLVALRQMTLSRLATGYFGHPDETLLQYDDVRSYAVHGEVAPEVDEEQAARFEWAVRDTFNQYLELSRQQGFTKRSQLTAFLDDEVNRSADIEWIRKYATEEGRKEWAKYFEKILQASADASPDSAGPQDE
jgi:hypothetical protein